jgi:ribosomal protein S18 acetylase RimI-like enzyme
MVPWDSELFGFPVYELRCTEVQAEVLPAHMRCWLELIPRESLVFTKLPLGSVEVGRVLSSLGFYPVETLVELYLPMSRFSRIVDRPLQSWRIRQAEAADWPSLSGLASMSFRNDRFHRDPSLCARKADERYAQWVERGLRSGEPVFVLEHVSRNEIGGFYHLRRIDDGTIDLSLAAVAPAYQRSGLGSLFYQEILADCQKLGYAVATTRVSVTNLDVLNLFARLGFTFRNPVLVFHSIAAGASANGDRADHL